MSIARHSIVVVLLALLTGSALAACDGNQQSHLTSGKDEVQTNECRKEKKLPDVGGEMVISQWENELGSTMNITDYDPETGAVTGTYASPSGTAGEAFPLTGWANPGPAKIPIFGSRVVAVSFSVNWGQYGSITSWNGILARQGTQLQITATWLLTRAQSDYIWDHTLTGQDRFTEIQE